MFGPAFICISHRLVTKWMVYYDNTASSNVSGMSSSQCKKGIQMHPQISNTKKQKKVINFFHYEIFFCLGRRKIRCYPSQLHSTQVFKLVGEGTSIFTQLNYKHKLNKISTNTVFLSCPRITSKSVFLCCLSSAVELIYFWVTCVVPNNILHCFWGQTPASAHLVALGLQILHLIHMSLKMTDNLRSS